jgi:hypothetical protein
VLIKIFPMYEWDEYYGFIACAQTPYNLLLPFLFPIKILGDICGFSKDKINNFLAAFLYLPIMVVLTTIFTAFNALMMPFTYIKTLATLFISIFSQKSGNHRFRNVMLTFKFLIFGALMLGFSVIIDPIVFMYNLFVEMEKDKLNLDGAVLLTSRGIQLFQDTCDEVIQSKTKQIKHWDGKINFVEFNLQL